MTIEPLHLARSIIQILDEKKGEDILLLDLEGISTFTDYFVLCSGTSERALKALTAEVTRRVEKEHSTPARSVEGDAASGWVLLDYGDVILHLFSPTLRDYYRLEELWSEGQVLVRMQ